MYVAASTTNSFFWGILSHVINTPNHNSRKVCRLVTNFKETEPSKEILW